MKYCSLAIFTLCLIIIAGCGSGHVSLKGRVTFSDDGSPLTVGSVILSKPNFESRGDLNDKGEFVMESLRPRDGIPPGTYGVSIVGATDYSLGGVQMLIDPKWANPETSGMTIDVDRKTKYLEIKVDRNP